MEGLLKIGRRGGLFGVLFSRPRYRTLRPEPLDDMVVPAGFETDLVSSPWWGRFLLPLRKMNRPALRHDMRRKLQLKKSLKVIDKQFYQEMLEEGVPGLTAWLAWQAVKLNSNR